MRVTSRLRAALSGSSCGSSCIFIDNVACEAGVHKSVRFPYTSDLQRIIARLCGGYRWRHNLQTLILQYPCSVVRWFVCALLSLPVYALGNVYRLVGVILRVVPLVGGLLDLRRFFWLAILLFPSCLGVAGYSVWRNLVLHVCATGSILCFNKVC